MKLRKRFYIGDPRRFSIGGNTSKKSSILRQLFLCDVEPRETFFYLSRRTTPIGCHPRIETSEHADFITSRTRDSRLWFVNNEALEQRILGLVAKYATRRTFTLYGFAIEGNHLHIVAHNNKQNRGHFLRDLKSTIARAVPRLTPSYSGGGVWNRRYSNEFLADPSDVEDYFFYTVLQPVKDGLVEKISDYPGYEELSQKEYALLMTRRLEERRQEILKARAAEGKKPLGRTALKRIEPGSLPKSTKTSTPTTHRPRILSACNIRRAEMKSWYFGILFRFKTASEAYRSGDLTIEFPKGTYRPYVGPVT